MPTLVDLHGHVGFVDDLSFDNANYTRETIVDQLNRYAYHGVGVIVSLGTDPGDLAFTIKADQGWHDRLARQVDDSRTFWNRDVGGQSHFLDDASVDEQHTTAEGRSAVARDDGGAFIRYNRTDWLLGRRGPARGDAEGEGDDGRGLSNAHGGNFLRDSRRRARARVDARDYIRECGLCRRAAFSATIVM
jgi:hypothetical protein